MKDGVRMRSQWVDPTEMAHGQHALGMLMMKRRKGQ